MTIYTFSAALLKVSTIVFPIMPMSASTQQSAFNPLSFQNAPTVELWRPSLTIVPMVADDWREIAALIRKLRGRTNRLRLFDPSRTLRGAGGATSTINIGADAVAGATSITLKNLTVSQAVALAADDLIGIGENLYAISDDAPSDGSGEATVNILPALRQGVAVDDPVNLASPTGLFMLAGDPAHAIHPGGISEPLQMEFIEAPDFE